MAQFVIPHGDHNHYIKVRSAGLADYLAHRLYHPIALQKGDLDKSSRGQQQLLAESRSLYASGSIAKTD